jgi:hypothetical protein
LGLIAYVVLAKFIVSAIGKYTKSKAAKYVSIEVFVLIPTWDIVPGRLYFSHLCEREGGIKVFKTVELDKAYFLPNGQPDQTKLSMSDNFAMVRMDDRGYSPIFHIARFESALHDKQNDEVLGVDVHLAHYGGWLNAYLFPQGPPTRCAGYSPYRDVWTEIIRPKSTSSEGGK